MTSAAGKSRDIWEKLREIRIEQQRRDWQRQAARAKRRWFSCALRQGKPFGYVPKYVRKRSRVSALLWLLGFFAALQLSLWLLLQTGKSSISVTESYAIQSSQEDGWERELFGFRFRIQDGEIVIFREREERKRKRER